MAAKINKLDKKSGLQGLATALVERIQMHFCKQVPPIPENSYPKAAEIEPFSQSYLYSSAAPEKISCELNGIEDSVLPLASDEQLDKFINPEMWTDDLEKVDREQ